MNQVQIKQSIAENWITAESNIVIPKSLIEYKGTKISMLGNFSAIIGAAKSKKSYLIMYLVGEALKGSNELFKFNFNKDKREIIYIDTEQSHYETKLFVQNIKKIAGKKNTNLKTINIRDFSAQERIEIITDIIQNSSEASLIVIDGVRDLVDSINNESAATQVNNYLLKWTKKYDKHIIVVIHTNKDGNEQARGHLGSEVVNKAETTILVTRLNDQKSKITCKYSRAIPFEAFILEIKQDGLPHVQDIESKSATKAKKQIITIESLQYEEIKEVLGNVLPEGMELTYEALKTQLREQSINNIGQLSRDKSIVLIERGKKEHILTFRNAAKGKVMYKMQY